MKLPKLSLRDLFWLVLVCALAVGWWVEHDRANDQRRRADQWHENALHLHQHHYQATGQSVELLDENGIQVKDGLRVGSP